MTNLATAEKLRDDPSSPPRGAIAIIDLGGQYCHLIGRRLRDFGVRSDIFTPDVRTDDLRDYAGIILSGDRKAFVMLIHLRWIKISSISGDQCWESVMVTNSSPKCSALKSLRVN